MVKGKKKKLFDYFSTIIIIITPKILHFLNTYEIDTRTHTHIYEVVEEEEITPI